MGTEESTRRTLRVVLEGSLAFPGRGVGWDWAPCPLLLGGQLLLAPAMPEAPASPWGVSVPDLSSGHSELEVPRDTRPSPPVPHPGA